MNRMFLNELKIGTEIGVSIADGIEHQYKILDIYSDGLKLVKYKVCNDDIKEVIVLMPYTSIKYVRFYNEF